MHKLWDYKYEWNAEIHIYEGDRHLYIPELLEYELLQMHPECVKWEAF